MFLSREDSQEIIWTSPQSREDEMLMRRREKEREWRLQESRQGGRGDQRPSSLTEGLLNGLKEVWVTEL